MFVVITLIMLSFSIFMGYRRYQNGKILKRKFFDTVIFPKLSITLLLVFLNEHPVHKGVVLRFANYLEKCFGFRILFELFDCETIYQNPASWLENSITSSDMILVIWSPGAEERWNNPEKFTDRLDLFTPVIKQIKNDLGLRRNLSKYIFTFFEYCDKKKLPKNVQNSSISCFNLMTQFYYFCTKMVEYSNSSKHLSQKSKVNFRNKSIESVPAEAIALERSISEMLNLMKNGQSGVGSNSKNQTTTEFMRM